MEKWLIDSGNAVVEDWAKNEPHNGKYIISICTIIFQIVFFIN